MIKLAHKTIDNEDLKVLIKFLKKKKYFNQAKVTRKFENNFSKKIKVKKSLFVNSGSSANLLIAQTLLEGNFLKNKIVILPSVSGRYSKSFIQLGYKIIICDCDQKNLGLDIKHLEKLCKQYKPGLVVAVNVLGHSNSYNQILKLKNKYNFKIIEDGVKVLVAV